MSSRTPKLGSSTAAIAALAIGIATACSSSPEVTAKPATAMIASVAAPPPDASKATDLPGLHNVVTYDDGVVCGGQPEGGEGLHTLAAMGIKTIVSVDGATPDVATAASLGMRYVHLPISYDTVTANRQTELAQALLSCEGPVYMHCHHGKHRSAAALASAMVLAGKLTPDQAAERMKVSGTAKEYTGLWQAVAAAKPLPLGELKVDPASFPSVSKVTGLVATMAEIDAVIDLVKQAKAAGWQAPQDHPDLVATKETARLAALFAALQQDSESLAHPAEYQTILGKSIAASAALDAAVRTNDAAQAEQQLTALTKSCKECHANYRDK